MVKAYNDIISVFIIFLTSVAHKTGAFRFCDGLVGCQIKNKICFLFLGFFVGTVLYVG